MSKEDKAKGAEKQPKKDKKDKKDKKGAKADGGLAPCVANHPRGRAHVRRAKGWGGLLAFAITGLLSHKANVPASDVLLRALVAGVAGYLAAGFIATTVWRSFVRAELRIQLERMEERRAAQAAERAEQTAAVAAAAAAKQRAAANATPGLPPSTAVGAGSAPARRAA